MNPELKTIQDEIVQTTKALYEALKDKTDETSNDIKRLSTHVDNLHARISRPDYPSEHKNVGGIDGYVTPGNRIVAEKGIFDDLKRNSRVRISVGQLWPSFEEKTLIDSAAVGFSTPGIIGATRIESSIVPLARRRLTIRDMLRTKPVTTGQLDFIKENSFTNSGSPQAEGSDKGESANTFVIGSERIRTIAHWIPVSKQVIDDVPELRRFLDDNLIYGLKLKEETELLNGDDLGDHLNGIVPQATAYAGTYAVAGDTRLDVLRHAMLELEAADERCTGFVLNPRDAHNIDLLKTEEGGANKGSYVVGDPLGGTLNVKTYWGIPVVVTNSMTSGRFLAGDFTKAVIGDRMDATVDMSESHDDYFTKNKLAIRCEERLALAVLRPGAFRYGSF